MASQGDITKLPKWAQVRIRILERDVAALTARLSEGPADSDTFADPHAGYRGSAATIPLRRGELIEFRPYDDDDRTYFQARLVRDSDGVYLEVRTDDLGLLAEPKSSNVIHLWRLRGGFGRG